MVTQKTHPEPWHPLLLRLADLYGVQTRYRDALGKERSPSADNLVRILVALGAHLDDRIDLAQAVRIRQAEVWARMVEPVLVAWEGALPGIELRIPASAFHAGAPAWFTLTLEDGRSVRRLAPLEWWSPGGEVEVDGRRFAAVSLSAGRLGRMLKGLSPLPLGYHQLHVELAESACKAVVISAPRRCWQAPGLPAGGQPAGTSAQTSWTGARIPAAGHIGATGRATRDPRVGSPLRSLEGKPWGLFAPVYALRSRRDWGAGDLAELQALQEWTAGHGGSFVATLPLLSTFSEEKADPSPYRPLSRLFWNELFLAPEAIEGWGRCASARLRTGGDGPAFADREGLRATALVDYPRVMALKRPVFEELAQWFLEEASDSRREDFAAYVRDNPSVRDYAIFRAAREASRATAADVAPPMPEEYHLFCQWQMDRQLAALAGGDGPGLLFDLPLGVHPHGFDVHRWPELFATGVSTGAPPDGFFSAGQDWETLPLRPEADRGAGYLYLRACLGNLMRYASILRVDHMMSFHRLFWIPDGAEAKEGGYVGYPAEELYAVLSCESHRYRTEVVGEDLGTVPEGVRRSMGRHSVARTAIVLPALRPRAKDIFPRVPVGSLATLETHDMIPLAGFLEGDDIIDRLKTGQLDEGGARREAAERRRLVARLARRLGAPDSTAPESRRHILAGCLAYLAGSPAKAVLVNLEDLLLEARPQNVPGTGSEFPNWRRKMSVRLEDLPQPRSTDRAPTAPPEDTPSRQV